MTIYHNGKPLILYKDKTAGEHTTAIDGFYKNDLNEKFFIKQPANKRELLAEALAGAILKEMIDQGLIESTYYQSVITAQIINLNSDASNPSYALIQPEIEFKPLHEIINTTYIAGEDRSALWETIRGPVYYQQIMDIEQFGLSFVLMISLVLSAHSVHSGNMVLCGKQMARLDWGDAFRNLATPENNENIIYAHENQGLFNYKKYTKEYFLNYANIPGLYPAMAQKAQLMTNKLDSVPFVKIISAALKNLPKDLVNESVKKDFLTYMGLGKVSSFELGPNSNGGEFAESLAQVLTARLDKITQLKDIIKQKPDQALYQSYIQPPLPPMIMDVDNSNSFSETIANWQTMLTNDIQSVNLDQLAIPQLAIKFNEYLTAVVNQVDINNGWQHNPDNSHNLFVDIANNKTTDVQFGHAFVPQYKEKAIFKNLFTLDPQTMSTFRFAPYEPALSNYCKTHNGSTVNMLNDLFTTGNIIISLLNTAQKGARGRNIY